MQRFIAFILGLELFLSVSAVILLFVTPEQSAKLNLNKPLSFLDKVCWFVIFSALTFAILYYLKIGYLLKTAYLFLVSAFANIVYFFICLFLLVVFLGLLLIVGNSSSVSKSDNDSDSFSSLHTHNNSTNYSSDDYNDLGSLYSRRNSHTDYSSSDDDGSDSD